MTICMKQAIGLVLFAASAVATNAFAHTTIVQKNTPDEFAVRKEMAGTSSVFNQINIPHGCNGEAVKAISVLLPNGSDPVVEDHTGAAVDAEDFFDHLEDDNNIVMGARPAYIALFETISVLEGPVRLYDNHGLSETDVRAFQYRHGTLPTHLVGLFPFRMTYGAMKEDKICLEKVELRIPIVNFCTQSQTAENRVDAWIGRLTAKFNDPAVVSEGFWPVQHVLNPHYDEAACTDGGGEPYYYKVSPSDADIDAFSPVTGFWPADMRGFPFFDFN